MYSIVRVLMYSTNSSWCKCFIGFCTCTLDGSKLFAMAISMKITVADQQFNLLPDVCGS
jgi:hypothetical protein